MQQLDMMEKAELGGSHVTQLQAAKSSESLHLLYYQRAYSNGDTKRQVISIVRSRPALTARNTNRRSKRDDALARAPPAGAKSPRSPQPAPDLISSSLSLGCSSLCFG